MNIPEFYDLRCAGTAAQKHSLKHEEWLSLLVDFVQVTPLKVKPSKETFKVVGIAMEYT